MTDEVVRLPVAVIKAVKSDIKAGYTFREIAQRNRVAAATIYKVKRLNELPKDDRWLRLNTGRRCRHSEETVQAIIADRKAGMPLLAIAKKYGVSQSYPSALMNGHVRK